MGGGVPDAGGETGNADSILQAYRHSSERACPVAGLCKRLSLRYHDLCETVSLSMGIESLLAVSKQYFLGVDVAALNISDQQSHTLTDNLLIPGSYG